MKGLSKTNSGYQVIYKLQGDFICKANFQHRAVQGAKNNSIKCLKS